MNGSSDDHDASHARARLSLEISDTEGDDLHDHAGDYSTRLEELMSDGDDVLDTGAADDEDDDEGGFVYDGVDAESAAGYREQLRDVLGPDHEEDELEAAEVERSLSVSTVDHEKLAASMPDEAALAVPEIDILSDHTPSASSTSQPIGPAMPRMLLANGNSTPTKPSRPFIHPSISRLRSSTPEPSRATPANSATSMNSFTLPVQSTDPSHFSELSRMSSQTNVSAAPGQRGHGAEDREVFRWTQLRTIGDYLYSKHPQKASALLGVEIVGSPTVLAANGLICIGTDGGKVLVFDFKQNLKCICGVEPPDRLLGAVTAVALSFDHTFVACGYSSGHIHLFDLANPKVPARSVAPTTLAAVASGTQEGHLVGSRIVSIGFIAGRHTAIVSSDDHGLAFFHSLGKVLFVEASDVLRILGKYPDTDAPVLPRGPDFFRRRRKARLTSTILCMAPLPLGPCSHPTDQYNLIALLTPIKLVIVGLKPLPRTWYRYHRESDEEVAPKSRFKGTLAWFPSVSVEGALGQAQKPKSGKTKGQASGPSTTPMLIYSWGSNLHLLKVSETKVTQQKTNSRTGKVQDVEVGRVTFEEASRWTAGGDVLAIQWLNVNQVVILVPDALEVYDVRSLKLVEYVSYNAWTLVSPILSHTTNGSVTYSDAVSEVAHSFRVYKGKIFVLGQHDFKVGTLLTWADRILSFVEAGDFLSAIELTRSYYVGEAPGNRNGLPDIQEKLKDVVGDKMRDLMAASTRYAFSEDRLTDGTHVTPDGRGVDRTDLFEGLVRTCARACIALDDFDFLFEDLFGYYDANGITRIYLLQLEPFVLDRTIKHVPPRITQRLVALHDDDGHPDLIERVIWHIDPECLDINQAITLCQNYHLFDALIYVYTRALKDYVSPVVELLQLIRQVQRYRRAHAEGSPLLSYPTENDIEPVVLSAYKIYPYLADVLTGLTYPSEEPLPEDEATEAKNRVYSWIFSGHSSVWPEGEGGKLVLSSDEENSVEPTYPYTKLLLRFDPEAFLHTLDLAFEDSYFIDETRPISRLYIVMILLEILHSIAMPSPECTFVHIFLARNIPKYPQSLETVPLSTLHNLLIGLAQDTDLSTREDRQLAAEYLLSAYMPTNYVQLVEFFEEAGFYRILRTWYRREKHWPSLLRTYLEDPELSTANAFPSINEIFEVAKKSNKGSLPEELDSTVTDSLPALLGASVVSTAALIDRHMPALHERALDTLGADADQQRFAYLRYLLGSSDVAEEHGLEARKGGPSTNIPVNLREQYVALHCKLESGGVIDALAYLPADFLDPDTVMSICEQQDAYGAVIWVLDRKKGDPQSALVKAQTFDKILSTRLADQLARSVFSAEDGIQGALSALQDIGRIAVSLCLERSKPTSSVEVPLEDIWFQLLRSQIDSVQRVASCCAPEALSTSEGDLAQDVKIQRDTVSTLRLLVQRTFTSLMSVSSTKAVSFPRLFRRLVESASESNTSKHTLYAEFRTILTGMLDSFTSEGDQLVITKRLVDHDLFDTMEEFAAERVRGWAPSHGTCHACGDALFDKNAPADGPVSRIVVSRTGAVYHNRCVPSDHPANTITVP